MKKFAIFAFLALFVFGCGGSGSSNSPSIVGGGGGELLPQVTSPLSASSAFGYSFSYTIIATNNPTSYGASGLPSGLSVNTSSGVISGTPTSAGTSSILISATNSAGTGSAMLTLDVSFTVYSPTISSVSTATGTVGTAFTYTITANNSPTSYDATGLPSGLSVNTLSGIISGTPIVAGTSSITISATNAGGTGSATLTLTINNPPAPAITSSLTATGAVTAAFSYQITASNSPTSYSTTGLPSWLSVNTATGVISGTPTVVGTFSVILVATNAGGTGTAVLALTITPNTPPTISAIPDQTIEENGWTPHALPFTVGDAETSSGSLVVTCVASNGTLVPSSNLTLVGNSSNRSLTITPAKGLKGKSTITVTVTDAGGLTASTSFVLTVQGIIKAISCGANHSLALMKDGTVWSWGCNVNGQLGNGNYNNSSIPTQMKWLSGIIAISAGANHSLALDSNGTVWAWGCNTNGQLGDGTTWGRTIPEMITGFPKSVAIAAGASTSFVIGTDGTVWGTGYNAYGELCDGTTTSRMSPVQALGLPSIQAIAPGGSHTVALAADGSVFTWGLNQYGECATGNAGTIGAYWFYPFKTAYTGKAISAGISTTFIVQNDGTILSCGYNYHGALGTGDMGDHVIPINVVYSAPISPPPNLSNVVAIGGNSQRYNTFALKSDGTVWSWGDNTYSSLGQGSGPYCLTSAGSVTNLTDITAVSTGFDFSLALDKDGILWSCGFNSNGELGIGSVDSNRYDVPIQVNIP